MYNELNGQVVYLQEVSVWGLQYTARNIEPVIGCTWKYSQIEESISNFTTTHKLKAI